MKRNEKGGTALITGASSGIGLAVSEEFAKLGYDVIGVSRTEGGFADLKNKFAERKFTFISLDLSTDEGIATLLRQTEGLGIDIFFANAGFGTFGPFTKIENDRREEKMIQLNVISNQMLIKEFLRRFTKAGKGRVLVTDSAAAFAPAPYMASYFATKVYIYYLCLGYWRELKAMHSKCSISILCPGPVATNFEKAGNLTFQSKPVSATKVAKVAVKGLFKGKTVIVPTLGMKLAHFFSHFFSKKFITGLDKHYAE